MVIEYEESAEGVESEQTKSQSKLRMGSARTYCSCIASRLTAPVSIPELKMIVLITVLPERKLLSV